MSILYVLDIVNAVIKISYNFFLYSFVGSSPLWVWCCCSLQLILLPLLHSSTYCL